jgi:hypothetical protein
MLLPAPAIRIGCLLLSWFASPSFASSFWLLMRYRQDEIIRQFSEEVFDPLAGHQ